MSRVVRLAPGHLSGRDGMPGRLRYSLSSLLATLASTPLTNRPEFAVEYFFASSTASDITTPTGVSVYWSSYTPIRRMVLSTAGMRAIRQPVE